MQVSQLLTSNWYSINVFPYSIYALLSILTSSVQTTSWCVPLNFTPVWFARTFLMAYSKVMFECNGNKNISLFQILHRFHLNIFINLSRFIWIPHSLGYYKKPSFQKNHRPSESLPRLYSHCFSNVWQIKHIWTVVDLFNKNPHWWSPVISTYSINLKRRMIRFLCVC
jgi:hypothetical protein